MKSRTDPSEPQARRPPRERASTFVISITPFTSDGSFDEDGTRRHLRRMAQAGIGVYLGGGGSGEGFVLTELEVHRLLQIGVEELQGAVPIRAMGTEPRTAAEMVHFIEVAADAGVDAVQIYSLDQGHGHRPAGSEIRTYLDDVLSATRVPAVLSTHQSVGYQVPIEMVAELAERYPHIIGINCSHQDLNYLAGLIDAVGDRIDVHVGGPHLALTALSLGATGFLSSEANLAPRLCQAVIDAHLSGDGAQLTRSYGTLLRLSLALYRAGGIRATKGILGRWGLPGGPPRKPQLPVTDSALDDLVVFTEGLGLAPGTDC